MTDLPEHCRGAFMEVRSVSEPGLAWYLVHATRNRLLVPICLCASVLVWGTYSSPASAQNDIEIRSVQLPNSPDYCAMPGLWTWLADQQPYALTFPPGTAADRVEAATNEHEATITIHGIADMRGARIGVDGRTWFHDHEPVPGEPLERIGGYEWLRSGPISDDEATDKLTGLFYPGAHNTLRISAYHDDVEHHDD